MWSSTKDLSCANGSEVALLPWSSLSELMHIFGAWIPFSRLQPKGEKANSRQRDYSLAVTFWAFLWQVLTPCTPCLEVVRKVQSVCGELKLKIPGSSNVAYCKARRRLASKDIDAVRQCVLERVLAGLPSRQRSRLLRPHCYLDTPESSWFGLEPG
jgi:hypothetical protein